METVMVKIEGENKLKIIKKDDGYYGLINGVVIVSSNDYESVRSSLFDDKTEK